MDASPLGRLPAELRNYISELAMTLPGGIQIDVDRNAFNRSSGAVAPVLRTVQGKAVRAALSLPSTCRQLRQETLDLFWHLNNAVEIQYDFFSDALARDARTHREVLERLAGVHPLGGGYSPSASFPLARFRSINLRLGRLLTDRAACKDLGMVWADVKAAIPTLKLHPKTVVTLEVVVGLDTGIWNGGGSSTNPFCGLGNRVTIPWSSAGGAVDVVKQALLCAAEPVRDVRWAALVNPRTYRWLCEHIAEVEEILRLSMESAEERVALLGPVERSDASGDDESKRPKKATRLPRGGARRGRGRGRAAG